MIKDFILVCVICLGILLLFSIPYSFSASGPEIPFKPGEQMHYTLKWQFVPAGKATLKVMPMTQVNGVDAYHFVLTAKSNSTIDYFYKVRDQIESYVDTQMHRSLLYLKNQREGKTRREVVVQFDWDKQKAQYTNFKKSLPPINIQPGTFDPLGVFFFSRIIAFEIEKEVTSPITDGKVCIMGKAKILRRETIEVPAGTFDTYVLQPELKHLKGVFRRSKNAYITIWVTADERRLLVKLKSKVVVGNFIGELEKYEQNSD